MAKPTSGTYLNSAHGLTTGLVHAWAFLEGSGTTTKDSITGLNTTINSSFWSTDSNGPILANPGTIQLCSDSTIPTFTISVVVGYRKRDTTTRQSGMFGNTAGDRAGAHFPWNDGNVYWDFGPNINPGQDRLYVGQTVSTTMTVYAFTADATAMQMWNNGTNIAYANNAHSTRTVSSGATWGIGQHGGSAPDQYDIAFIYVYNRVLTGTEHASIASNPYQMFGGGTPLIPAADSASSGYLEPISAGANNDWYADYANSPTDAVDELVYQPATTDYTQGYIYCYYDNQIQIFNMSSISAATNVTKIRVWIYGEVYTYSGADEYIKVDIYCSGAWKGEQNLASSSGWQYVDFNNPGTSLSGVQLKLRYADPNGYQDSATIYRCYIEATYTSGPATAVTFSGPTSGAVGLASPNFTVGANGNITGSVVVTPNDSSGGGTFTPTSVTISSSTPTGTFTYTPASSGAKTLTATNNGSLTNPSVTYTALAPSGTVNRTLIDTTTQGSWIGVYGANGYWIANDAQNLPSYATVVFANQTAGTWTTGTDVRYLQRVSPNSDRIASYWYNNTQFTMTVTVSSPKVLSLYFMDYDPAGRAGIVKVYDTNNNIVLFNDTISSYSAGKWWKFSVNGTLKFEFTATSSNFVLNGIMFDSPSGPATAVTLTGPATGAVNIPSTFTAGLNGTSSGVVVTPNDNSGGGTFSPTTVTLNTASPSATFTYTPATTGTKTIRATNNGGLTNPANLSFLSQDPSGFISLVNTDYATQGTWKGTYGADGHIIVNDHEALPSYASYTAANNNPYTWNGSTTDVRATQKFASTTDRIASGWYNNTEFTVDITVTGGTYKDVSLYFLDWDGPRSVLLKAEDTSFGIVLLTTTIPANSNYTNGTWLRFRMKGTVRFRFTSTGAYNSTVNGIMFDPLPGPATSLALSGPNGGPSGSASANLTVSLKPNISYGTTNTTVTPVTDLTGTFTPSTVVLNDSTKSATFTFTPSAVGEHRITVTNNNSLSNGNMWGFGASGSPPAGSRAVAQDHQYSGSNLYETNNREAVTQYSFSGPQSFSIPAGPEDVNITKTGMFLTFM